MLAPKRLLPELVPWWQVEQAAGRVPAASPCPEQLASDKPERIFEPLRSALAAGQRVVLLASGDPLWFGIGRLLLQEFPPEQLRFHPAPACLQLAFARLGRPWQDASWISLHGRDSEPLAAALQKRPPALAVLTDPQRGGAQAVRLMLRASGLEAAYGVWLGERLGHAEERMTRLVPGDPLPADLDPLHLVLLVAEPAPAPMSDTEIRYGRLAGLTHPFLAFASQSWAGGVLLLVYALYRRDPVFILGQAFGVLIYLRNLSFVLRERREEKAKRGE